MKYFSGLARNAVVVLIVAGSILAIAFGVPLSKDRQPVVQVNHAETTYTLRAGETITQTFQAKQTGRILGVTIYAKTDRVRHQRLSVSVEDGQGHHLRSSLFLRSSYDVDHMRLRFLVFPFSIERGKHYALHVTLKSGEDIPLLVTTDNYYHGGDLRTNGTSLPDKDLAFSIGYRAPTPDGVHYGEMAGVMFLLGAFLVSLIQAERYRSWAGALLLVGITPLAIGGFWFSQGFWGIDDWDLYFQVHSIYRDILLKFHEFPFWNPYICGGTAGLADPEFSLFSITYPLELLFGIPVGIRLVILESTIVGALGMYVLARRLVLSVEASLLVALGGFLGTVNLLEIVEGHVNIFAAMWIPWIFWAWLSMFRAPTSRARHLWALGCGIFLALTFFQGGIYLLFYTTFAFLVLPFLTKRPFRAIFCTVEAALWAMGIAAVKLFPVLLWLQEFPDEGYGGSAYTLPYLYNIFLGRYLRWTEVIPYQNTGWHEYGAYIGPFILLFALLALVRIRTNRIVRGLCIAVLLTAFISSMGPYLKPIYDHVPYIPRSNTSRVIFYTVISLALLSGYGFDAFRKRLPEKFRVVSILFLGFTALDLMSLSYPLSQQAFVVEPVPSSEIPQAEAPIAYTLLTYDKVLPNTKVSRAYAAYLKGYGTLTYCTPLGPDPHVRPSSDEGPKPYVSLKDGHGSVSLLSWSPNTVRVHVNLSEEDTILLNANYAKGWYANGKPARPIGERVAATIPVGEQDVVFTYKTPGFPLGLSLTLLTLLAAGGVGMREVLRKKK